jgi:cell division protein FtsB
MKEGKFKISAFLAKVFLLIGLGILTWAIISVAKETYKKNQIQKEISVLQAEAQKISQENSLMKEKIAYLESKEYQEKEAKDKLGMRKPEEKVIAIKPGREKKDSEINSSSKDSLKNISAGNNQSNYLKWWNYFFKY